MLVCLVTIVTVSDTVLQHSVPLLLLLLRHHTEVVVAGVRVPQDEGELGRTLNKRITAHFSLNTYNRSHDRMVNIRFRKCFTDRFCPLLVFTLD